MSAKSTVIPPYESPKFADLYPERRGRAVKREGVLTSKYDETYIRNEKTKCYSHIVNCFENWPPLKLMWSALEANGCALDLDRHISCDICIDANRSKLENRGGYDPSSNQVFVCANNIESSRCCGTLLRGLISMFDQCKNKIDYANPDHLACTEIRKANLAHCNFLLYYSRPDAKFNIKGNHKLCVRNVAVESMIESNFVDKEVAEASVDRVFDKCYADLEPIGRRARNQEDVSLAFYERYLFGF